ELAGYTAERFAERPEIAEVLLHRVTGRLRHLLDLLLALLAGLLDLALGLLARLLGRLFDLLGRLTTRRLGIAGDVAGIGQTRRIALGRLLQSLGRRLGRLVLLLLAADQNCSAQRGGERPTARSLLPACHRKALRRIIRIGRRRRSSRRLRRRRMAR